MGNTAMNLPHIHLCIVQPAGFVHSLGFLDQARFFRHQFRRMGADVTLAKNRLRHGAVNVVFGAHLGFDAALRARYTCMFVNLEQLGRGGARVSDDYLKLLGNSAVADYDAANVPAYTAHAEDVPLFSFAHAPYLAPSRIPLAERPIDLLFIGSMNDRRRRMLDAVEAAGARVTLLGSPVYGPERDELIGQARAVFNCHFYASARFEQARAFQCLSLGTPVISERSSATQPPAQFEDSVFWLEPEAQAPFFAERFHTPAFADEATAKLDAFRQHDVIEQFADVLAFAAGYAGVQAARLSPGPWRPRKLHIGSGKDYKPGWLNIDILPGAQPDALLDLARPQAWPLPLHSEFAGPVELNAGSLDTVYANNVLEHVSDLPCFMTNCLALLREGGQMEVEVPYEQAPSAWQDPTHVRAMNENSWVYYTEWFWYLGWFEARFDIKQSTYLDAGLQPCTKAGAHFMRVTLVKVATSLAERMTARTMQADFGGVPDDLALFDDARTSNMGSPAATAAA